MPSKGSFTVGQLAEAASVTVRTLHHYDEIGLVVPSGRTESGYRLYGPEEAERLHEVLLLRQLGLPLEEIRAVLDEPARSRLDTLLTHRARLDQRLDRTRAVIRALDTRIRELEEERPMEEVFEGFEAFDHAQHEDEVKERWGDSDAYRESSRRTKSYSPEQWKSMGAELESIEARWAELLEAGAAPDGTEATDVAESARLHIDRWFYPCSHRMHVGLAQIYEADPRFKEHYESRREGLASFVAGSIRANAEREG